MSKLLVVASVQSAAFIALLSVLNINYIRPSYNVYSLVTTHFSIKVNNSLGFIAVSVAHYLTSWYILLSRRGSVLSYKTFSIISLALFAIFSGYGTCLSLYPRQVFNVFSMRLSLSKYAP